MHLQSPMWCKVFGATSSTNVTFSSINSTFPKSIFSLKHGQENHNLSCFGGHSCLLNYFRKIDKQESLRIFLAVVWVLSVTSPTTKLKVLYTSEKYQTISLKIVICIQGKRWISQPFLGLENPYSPANKAFTSAFILKL